MLALIAIGCCVVLPFTVAGLAVLLGKSIGVPWAGRQPLRSGYQDDRDDSNIEHPGPSPPGSADREGSKRSGGQP